MNQTLRKGILSILPFSAEFKMFRKTGQQASYYQFFKYKIGLDDLYWPRKSTCLIANGKKIYVGINSLVGRPGVYIQGAGEVFIGDYVQLAPNVGVLSSNHDLYDQRVSNDEKIVIGDYCWIGMNSIILPGVKLGTRTIVAAGSVVTKSFPDGFCVIAGVPATAIKFLDKSKFMPWRDANEYYGFIERGEFERKHYNIAIGIRNEVS